MEFEIKQWDKKPNRIETYEIKEVTVEVARAISAVFGIGKECVEIVYDKGTDDHVFIISGASDGSKAGVGDCVARGIASHGILTTHKRSDIERDFTEATV